MSELPTGTVTFLFTDIEGSTVLVQRFGDQYRPIHEAHARLIRGAIGNGVEVSTEGDAFFFAFASAADAVQSAATIQTAIATHGWPTDGAVRVRIGLHSGPGTLGGDNYIGLDVHRAARIASSAHGGQIVLSATTEALVKGRLPDELTTQDLGEFSLKDLAQPERIYQLNGPGSPARFPPLRAVGSAHNNLPMPAPSFIGRAEILAEAVRLAQENRVLTLTGPGGTGKTRLGLRLAAEITGGYPDGVYFVDLSPITEAELVAPAIVTSAGLPGSANDPTAQLAEFFKEKKALLFLDNFEQVLEAARTVGELVRKCPRVSVLVTSRASLRIAGEQEMAVPPLPLPNGGSPAGNDAVRLFAERARAVRPEFQVDDANAQAVGGIVSRLDGLPLAIELAAARVKALAPAAILERLSDRLALLTTGARDLPDRQRTLRGAIAWSYDLLTPIQQSLFNRISVFVGPALLDQIEVVCGSDVLEAIEALVDHSLVRIEELANESGFRMLETIKEFASDNLTEEEAIEVRLRHARFFCDFAIQSLPHLLSRDRGIWLDRIESQHDNFRAALNHLIEIGEGDSAAHMADALWRFWQMRGHLLEGSTLVDKVLAMPGISPEAEAATSKAGGGLAWWRGDMPASRRHYRRALELHRSLADQSSVADDLYNLGMPSGLDDRTEAERLFAEGIAIYETLGDVHGMANILWAGGSLLTIHGEYEKALKAFDQALALFEQGDDVFMVGWSYRMHGIAALRLNLLQQARSDFDKALPIFAGVSDIVGVEFLLRDFAELALTEGDYERAFRLFGNVTAIRQQTGANLVVEYSNEIKGLEKAYASIGAERAEQLIIEGRAMTIPELVIYATSSPGARALYTGDRPELAESV